MSDRHPGTVVIGGGQAGLAIGLSPKETARHGRSCRTDGASPEASAHEYFVNGTRATAQIEAGRDGACRTSPHQRLRQTDYRDQPVLDQIRPGES